MKTQRVALRINGRGGVPLMVDTVGVVVAGAPGLLITPWHDGGRPVPGRFTLTTTSGGALVALGWCPHLARRWADQAGWAGVGWRADPAAVCASQTAYVFAWRLWDEYEPHCRACPAVPADAGFLAAQDRFRAYRCLRSNW